MRTDKGKTGSFSFYRRELPVDWTSTAAPIGHNALSNQTGSAPSRFDPLRREKAGYTPNAILDALCNSGWAGVLYHDIPPEVLLAARCGAKLPTPNELNIPTPQGYAASGTVEHPKT